MSDEKETRKITKIEIFVIFILIFAFSLYLYPKFFVQKIIRQNALVKTNNAICVQEVLAQFSTKKPGDVDFKNAVDETIKKLNSLNKNPINKKEPAFVYDKECAGCVSLKVNEPTRSITTTGYDKDLKVLTRSVMNPRSFVTYENSENENKWKFNGI